MSNFKIGDWVKNKYKTIKVKSFITLDKIDYIQDSENGLMPVWQAELWRPKEGEWCWMWNDGFDKPYLEKLMKIDKNGKFYAKSIGDRFKHCEPFIGELPSFIKDKQ